MAQAVRASNTLCPAAHLAREAARVIAAREWADRRHDNDAMETLQDRLDAIEDASTYERATSPLGAFFQALVVSAELDPQSDILAEGRHAQRTVRRLRRLTASIASFIEAGVEKRTAEQLRGYYMERRMDDLAVIDTMLAEAVH